VSNQDLGLTDVSANCATQPLRCEPLTADEAIDLAVKLRALADPIRLRLISQVASRADMEACVCDVSVGIDLSQPTISHHLKVLREAGLLDAERRGTWVYYRIVPGALQKLSSLLGAGSLEMVGDR
jgi:ArsR family transcriptional regulator